MHQFLEAPRQTNNSSKKPVKLNIPNCKRVQRLLQRTTLRTYGSLATTGLRLTMSNLQLLAAGFSAILGVEVVTPDQGAGLPKLSINQLFRCTYIMRPMESVDPGEVFEIYVKTLTGTTITIQATNDFTVAELKAAVEVKENIPARQQRLVFNSEPLQDDETVQGAGIPPGGTIFLIILLRGGGAKFQLDTSLLDPQYDYNLTGQKDDGRKYVRGGFPYKRPYGWSRVALKVLGNPDYGEDNWLGPGGIRTESASGEWPVSYHETNFESAKKIAELGYKAGPRAAFGKGVYSSPSLDMVEKYYAQSFSFEGKTYLIVFQNRVNPDVAGGRLVVIPAAENRSGADYWLSPKHNVEKNIHDIRPYGILLRLK